MAKNQGVLENIIWKFAERISAQFVTLLVSIILARVLMPSDYGTITLVMIFITFANVFVSDGLGSALIRKRDADALDFSSVLYVNIGFSVLLYGLLYFSAPWITTFFGSGYEDLTLVLRVLSIRLIFSAINSAQHAYISKKMIFRKFFAATLTGTVTSAIVGIWMAYNGFGVWALVAQYLTNTIIDTLFLAIAIKKKPLLKISFKRLQGLFGFGMGVLGVNLLITAYQELRAVLIGKVYSADDLAYYKKGSQFPDLLITNINTSISAVLFPQFARIQNDCAAVKQTAKKSVRLSFYIVAPMLVGLAAVADNFVTVLLTDKWAACVPFIQIFCLNSLFYTIHSTNMQLLKVMGKTKTFLTLEVIKKVIELVLLLLVFRLGVIWIAIAMAVTSTLFTYLNCIPTKKSIGYSFKEQFQDIFPSLIMVAIMFVLVSLVNLLHLPCLPTLIFQVLMGSVIYIGLSVATKYEPFVYIKTLLTRKLKEIRKKNL